MRNLADVNKKKFYSEEVFNSVQLVNNSASTCKYFQHHSSSCDLIVNSHHHHPPSSSIISERHQCGPSTSVVDFNTHRHQSRSSSVSVIITCRSIGHVDPAVRPHLPLTWKTVDTFELLRRPLDRRRRSSTARFTDTAANADERQRVVARQPLEDRGCYISVSLQPCPPGW